MILTQGHLRVEMGHGMDLKAARFNNSAGGLETGVALPAANPPNPSGQGAEILVCLSAPAPHSQNLVCFLKQASRPTAPPC